jgi:hypothetical protein
MLYEIKYFYRCIGKELWNTLLAVQKFSYIMIFWVMAVCSLVGGYQCFLLPPCSGWKLVPSYDSTQCCNSEHHNMKLYHCENLRPYMDSFLTHLVCVCHTLVPGECEYSLFRSRGPFKWTPKHKLAIFTETSVRILNKYKYFTETIAPYKRA